MANKDLFKQAIAEAKSVREAAIANAKEALEETLTPHLKDMLAAKLQEMDDSSVEEEVVNEVEEEVEEGMDKDKKDEAIEEDFTAEAEEMDAEEEADDDSEESEEEAEEDIEVKDMEVDDLKDLIRDIIAQEMGAEPEGEEMPADELPADDMVGADDEEEIDLDELLREIAEMSDEHKDEAMSHDDHKDEAMDHDKKDEAMYHDKKDEAMHHDKKDEAMHSDDHKDESMINEIDPLTVGAGVAAIFGAGAGLDKLMSKLKAGEFGDKGKKLAHGLEKAGSAAASVTQQREDLEVTEYVDKIGEDNALKDAMVVLMDKAKKAGKKVGDFIKDIEVGKMSDAMKEVELEETSELEEAMNTIEELKGQLQEVNLLNAKLLYVNKVFKANSLTESQKVSVIAAFDKAETVKEVKLVFETVADNVVGKTKKGTIKEAKLGMASKATGTTASKPEVIAEVSDAVKRMQKLAGIIK
jgi:hypothetical protein